MLKLAVLLLVSVVLDCALGAAVPDGRIVGGAQISIDKVPYQVSIQHQLNGEHFCGGSIISSKLIMTASHCVDGLTASQIMVSVQSTYIDSGTYIPVAKIVMHPNYSASTWDYDIAIITLSSTIYNAIPVTLPSRSYKDGDLAYVSGWGALSSGGSSPRELFGVDVRIITASSCNTNYPGKITARMICAASPGKDACEGDSGGPLVVDGVQVGIVSWGYGCADPNYPGVYVDVFALRFWIHDQTGI